MKSILPVFLLLLINFTGCAVAQVPRKINFKAPDSLLITADIYEVDSNAQWIILCHQARFSRGEYRETAIRFNELGFNCLAIDQRSGGEVNGVKNETAERAKKQKLGTDYLDAAQDILAAVNYLYTQSGRPVILMGSSYSASLSLKIARETDYVSAVIAFSPGEYFGDKLAVYRAAAGLNKPAFITSSQEEFAALKQLVQTIDPSQLTLFCPTGAGEHGSKVLWSEKPDQAEYWEALTTFLLNLKP